MADGNFEAVADLALNFAAHRETPSRWRTPGWRNAEKFQALSCLLAGQDPGLGPWTHNGAQQSASVVIVEKSAVFYTLVFAPSSSADWAQLQHVMLDGVLPRTLHFEPVCSDILSVQQISRWRAVLDEICH